MLIMYFAKFQQPGVLDIIDRNMLIMEAFWEVLDRALNNVSEFLNIGETFLQQENAEVEQEVRAAVNNLFQSDDPAEDAVLLEDAKHTKWKVQDKLLYQMQNWI